MQKRDEHRRSLPQVQSKIRLAFGRSPEIAPAARGDARRMADVWPTLPDAIKAGICAMIQPWEGQR